MAIPIPSPETGTIFKILLLINGVNAGSSEEYYFASSLGSFEEVFNALQAFFRARQACMNFNSTSLVAVRIGLVNSPRQTRLFTYNQLIRPQANTNAPEFPSLGWLVSAGDGSSRFKRKFTLKFVDQVDDTYGSSLLGGTPLSPVPPTTFLRVFEQWKDILLRGGASQNSANPSGKFCIRGQYAADPAAKTANVDAVSIDNATSSYALRLPAANPFTEGQNITVSGFRGSVTRGLNGPGRIIRIDVAGGVSTIITTRQPLQPGEPVITTFGKINYRPPAFFAISYLQLDRLVTHKTGRAFFVTPGRRPAR